MNRQIPDLVEAFNAFRKFLEGARFAKLRRRIEDARELDSQDPVHKLWWLVERMGLRDAIALVDRLPSSRPVKARDGTRRGRPKGVKDRARSDAELLELAETDPHKVPKRALRRVERLTKK